MDKNVLSQYIDACALISETETEIRNLKKRRKKIEQDTVKGSSQEFPYTPKNYKIEGIAYSLVKDPQHLEELERLLVGRMEIAAAIKVQAEEWMNTIPQRMQRIIRFRIFEGESWGQVAIKMGRKATADSIRMEFERFMENN